MIPIIGDEGGCRDYVTLDEALGNESAEITEVNDGGRMHRAEDRRQRARRPSCCSTAKN